MAAILKIAYFEKIKIFVNFVQTCLFLTKNLCCYEWFYKSYYNFQSKKSKENYTFLLFKKVSEKKMYVFNANIFELNSSEITMSGLPSSFLTHFFTH